MKGIRIGLGIADAGGQKLETLLDQFVAAEADGFAAAWVPNIFGHDALTLCALAGRATSKLEIGTAVVPTFSRHPFYMAQQALSTNAATGGRFLLGVGPSHKVVIENMLGLSYAKPARHVKEYVRVLKDLIDGGKTAFEGETYQVHGGLQVASPPCPVLVGALGPVMRRIAGTYADGTITWMTGPRVLGESLVPELRAAAEAAGRPAPRVVAGVPIALTHDPAGAREKASKAFALYGTLPSYRAMLDAEGASDPADLALVGDEKALEQGIARLASAGVTDFNAALFPYGDDPGAALERTRDFLATLSRG